ncbi:MAG: hypothetical protein HY518_01350 [Candidatus Aenigmarchaeota archaeon]|nr:hypothetical protein [Candidatus Aenigmarchaeota archaeon]
MADEFRPVYKADRLVYGDPKSRIAIASLWTKNTELAKRIDRKHYAVIGQLFSAERGLDILVRNLLANPQITNLVITGVDFSKSGAVLKDFFEKGVEPGKTEITNKDCWRVKSDYPGYIGLDIPKEALDELREAVDCVWIRDMNEFHPDRLAVPEKKRQRRDYPKKEEEGRVKYVGEEAAYIVRGRTVVEAWLKALDTILKFGKVDATHYEDDQKEVLNLMSVISAENPDSFYIPGWMPFEKSHYMGYIVRITTDMKFPDSSYTYGNRMRSWFGIDQIREAVAKLARQPISRAVVINLWDSTKDLTIGGSPCINHVWLRVRNERLCMTVTIRSNDMFEAYPDNAFGLRSLQEVIRKELVAALKGKGVNADIRLGELVINSQSAHVYKDCWDRAQALVDKYLEQHKPQPYEWDPRGSFVIHTDMEKGELVLDHISPSNEPIGEYRARTPEELRKMLSKEGVISLPAHALDLGFEIMKAYIAMKSGLEYNQDNPLQVEGLADKNKEVG